MSVRKRLKGALPSSSGGGAVEVNMLATPCTPGAKEALGLSHKYRLGEDPTAPLLFLVHGRAGTEDVMWAFRRCVPETFHIIAPQAPLPDPVGGFSWWDITTTNARDGGAAAAGLVRRFVDEAPAFYGIRPKLILACGFSQGAGTLSVALQHGAPFAGVALLAGFVVELETSPRSPTRPKIFIAHGTADEMVGVDRARRGRDYLRGHGFTVDYVEDPVGHKVGTGGMKALTTWLASFA